MSESEKQPMLMEHVNNTVHIADTMASTQNVPLCHLDNVAESCPNCDMTSMEMDCDAACCTHCASHVISLTAIFNGKLLSPSHGEIINLFKHFYSRTTSPEQRPPLA